MAETKRNEHSLEDALDLDVLREDALDMSEVEMELSGQGVDADRIDRWGRAVARERLNARRSGPPRELPWQSEARRRLAHARSISPGVDRTALPRDRAGLLSVVHRLRSQLGPQAEVVFRGREPEAADEDDLRGLIEDLMLLEALPDPTDGHEDEEPT